MVSAAKPSFAALVAKQREATILDAALARVNDRGYCQTTLDQVASDVGVGKGTLYRHFPSREALFSAAFHRGVQALRARCLELQEAHVGSSEAGLRAVIVELVSMNQRGAPGSPASLFRLQCGYPWMSRGDLDGGRLDVALIPLVRHWQVEGCVDSAADPASTAAFVAAIVSSPGVTGRGDRGDREGMEPSRARTRSQDPATTAVAAIADGVVDLLRRAFGPSISPSP